jgi:uncharacterized membrane protein
MPTPHSTTEEAAKTSIDRLTFFCDAVVAIAMTLLAIDLPVPDSASAPQLLAYVGDHVSEYSAFLISFLVIAQYWRAHHTVYRYVVDASARLVMPNVVWLLTVVLTPYATRVLYGGPDLDNSDMPWRFTFYAAVQVLGAAAFLWAQRVIERDGLLDPNAPPDLMPRATSRHLVITIFFVVSVPLAFWLHAWAFVVWALIPVGMQVARRVVVPRTTVGAAA